MKRGFSYLFFNQLEKSFNLKSAKLKRALKEGLNRDQEAAGCSKHWRTPKVSREKAGEGKVWGSRDGRHVF